MFGDDAVRDGAKKEGPEGEGGYLASMAMGQRAIAEAGVCGAVGRC